jgi:hypothetical protein
LRIIKSDFIKKLFWWSYLSNLHIIQIISQKYLEWLKRLSKWDN